MESLGIKINGHQDNIKEGFIIGGTGGGILKCLEKLHQ